MISSMTRCSTPNLHFPFLFYIDDATTFRTGRWEQLLYLPPIPNLDTVFDSDSAESIRVRNELKNVVPTSELRFANFSETKNNSTEWEQFRNNYIDVITFRDMFRTVKTVWNDKACGFLRCVALSYDRFVCSTDSYIPSSANLVLL